MRLADLPPVTRTTSRQLASSRPPFSQSGVPCSFLEPAGVSVCELPIYSCRTSALLPSRLTIYPDQWSALVTQVSCNPRTVIVPCSMLSCRRVRRRGEPDRSVMARGNLDFLYGQVAVLVIGQRGLFSRHLLNAHRFEFLLESLAPPSRAAC